MRNALILHGTLGSPEGNWYMWLKTVLEVQGIEVWLPQLPHAEQPSLRQESDFVHENCPFTINEETLIIGHSSGAVLALILVQQNPVPIGVVVGVSAFHDNSLNWEPNSKLFDVGLNWPAIQTNTRKLFFVHSDNDPYVPLDQAEYVARNCNAELVLLPGQGHFNIEHSEDYRSFSGLTEMLQDRGII